MKRSGIAFAPSGRGHSESISPATAGKLERRRDRDKSRKAKSNEEE
jgi:hypothetical protein